MAKRHAIKISALLPVVVLLWLLGSSLALEDSCRWISDGALSFRSNGSLYTAEATHARGYAIRQTGNAYVNGANSDNMVAGIEWSGIKGTGLYLLTRKSGKAEFTLDHRTYSIRHDSDYVRISVTAYIQHGAFYLLGGTFEGQLRDHNGVRIRITEGTFQTRSL